MVVTVVTVVTVVMVVTVAMVAMVVTVVTAGMAATVVVTAGMAATVVVMAGIDRRDEMTEKHNEESYVISGTNLVSKLPTPCTIYGTAVSLGGLIVIVTDRGVFYSDNRGALLKVNIGAAKIVPGEETGEEK